MQDTILAKGLLQICSVSLLAKSLSDLEPVVLVSASSAVGKAAANVGIEVGRQQHNMMPLFDLAQEDRLDNIIDKLEEAVEHREIHDISTSVVIELYEYKLAAVGHSEKALQVRRSCISQLVPLYIKLREFHYLILCQAFFLLGHDDFLSSDLQIDVTFLLVNVTL
jgi:hypothetical protein